MQYIIHNTCYTLLYTNIYRVTLTAHKQMHTNRCTQVQKKTKQMRSSSWNAKSNLEVEDDYKDNKFIPMNSEQIK